MDLMVDGFNRRITYIRVSITDRCNLRCTYCMPAEFSEWKEQDTILTYDEILRILSVAARRGLKKVRITGGEPLVRSGVVEFVERVAAISGIEDIAMTTNGVNLKNMAGKLFKAGLRHLNISLDSLESERFAKMTRGNVFARVWEGIEEAERVGFDPIKLNIVLQKGVNDDEVIDFVKLTINKTHHVRFIEYMPCSSFSDWTGKYLPVNEIIEKINSELGKLKPILKAQADGPSKNYRLEGAKGVVGFITAISDNHFCEQCNRIRLTADGKVRPCLFNDLEIDFRDPLRRGCSDDEVSALLDQVLGIKPKAHELDRYSQEKMLKSMVEIGG